MITSLLPEDLSHCFQNFLNMFAPMTICFIFVCFVLLTLGAWFYSMSITYLLLYVAINELEYNKILKILTREHPAVTFSQIVLKKFCEHIIVGHAYVYDECRSPVSMCSQKKTRVRTP